MKTNAVAVQAMFLYEGALYKLDVHRTAEKLDPSIGEHDALDRGYVGMAFDLAKHAEQIAAFLAPYEDNPRMEWPGVFEYEVTEPLGRWYADNPHCTWDEFQVELERRAKEYFEQP